MVQAKPNLESAPLLVSSGPTEQTSSIPGPSQASIKNAPTNEAVEVDKNLHHKEQRRSSSSNTCQHVRSERNASLHSPSQVYTNANVLSEDAVVPPPTWTQKLGKLGIFVLSAGTVVMLAALSFLAFLWLADYGNPTWHSIVIRNWLTKAVTICSEALKQAVTFQIGVCSAMLAALALERFEVLLPQVVAISMMRASIGSGNILSLRKQQVEGKKITRGWNISLPSLAALTATILALIQATTIVLVSDIVVRPIPGNPETFSRALGFTYTTPNNTNVPSAGILTEGVTWSRKAPFYPAFAEYSESPYVHEGVSDTGVTLRAFLPFSAAQDREGVQEYMGRTTVLDARVTCQVPALEDETVQMTVTSGYSLVVRGSVRASRSTPRLGNATILLVPKTSESGFDNVWNASVPFSCLAPTDYNVANASAEQWRMSFCQLGEGDGSRFSISGGLISEFKELSSLPGPESPLSVSEYSQNYGTAYLVFNVTAGSPDTWRAVTGSDGVPHSPPQFSQHGEWLDLLYSNGKLILSVSLCYSAFDTADLSVRISSRTNRTEPSVSFNFDKNIYAFGGIRKQMGQSIPIGSPDDRGILQLGSRSWIADTSERPPVEPFVRNSANLGGARGNGNTGNYSCFLSQSSTPSQSSDLQELVLAPDAMHIWLFQEIITNGGSVAFALQSLITLLSSMAYYDQLAQFNRIEPVIQTYFVAVNTPQHRRGLLAVVTVTVVHLILVTIIASRFLRLSRFSMLGNSWQAASQAVTPETIEYLTTTSLMTDKQVKQQMTDDGKEKLRVGLAQIEGTGRVGLVKLAGATIEELPKHAEKAPDVLEESA